MVKHLPIMRETQVQSLGQEDLLEKEMATHSSILAWKIPWTEEPGRPYNPWGRKELIMTERLHFWTQVVYLQTHGYSWPASSHPTVQGSSSLFLLTLPLNTSEGPSCQTSTFGELRDWKDKIMVTEKYWSFSLIRSRRVKQLCKIFEDIGTWVLLLMVICDLMDPMVSYGDGAVSKATSRSSRILQFRCRNEH